VPEGYLEHRPQRGGRAPQLRTVQTGNVTLSNAEIRRYSRHLIRPEVGMSGQKRLKNGSVLLVGAGGWDRRQRCT